MRKTFTINRGGDQKWIIFDLETRLTGRRGRGRRGRGKKGENQAKVWIHDFGKDSSVELYDFYIQSTWVWIARVFFGD